MTTVLPLLGMVQRFSLQEYEYMKAQNENLQESEQFDLIQIFNFEPLIVSRILKFSHQTNSFLIVDQIQEMLLSPAFDSLSNHLLDGIEEVDAQTRSLRVYVMIAFIVFISIIFLFVWRIYLFSIKNFVTYTSIPTHFKFSI